MIVKLCKHIYEEQIVIIPTIIVDYKQGVIAINIAWLKFGISVSFINVK